jgi:hypothetical protein
MLHTVRYFFLILLSKLNLCLYIYIYDYIYKTQTLLADGTSVLTCQNSCSSGLSCTGGCSIINGQYSGNYKRTSCCTTDSCNLLTTTVSTSTQSTRSTAYSFIYSSTVRLSVSLRVNLAFNSDYNNLYSTAATTFIQNYKTFVNII